MSYLNKAVFAAVATGFAFMATPVLAQEVRCSYEKSSASITINEEQLAQLSGTKVTGYQLASKVISAIGSNESLMQGAPTACRQPNTLKGVWLQTNNISPSAQFDAAELRGRPLYLIRYVAPAPSSAPAPQSASMPAPAPQPTASQSGGCLLYTSDAADDM
jgi:hypothetical protein